MRPEADPSGETHTAYHTPTHDQIARRAYELWTEAGQPEGRSLEHWLSAERALRFPASIEEELNPAIPPLPPPMGAAPSPMPPTPRTSRGESAPTQSRSASDH